MYIGVSSACTSTLAIQNDSIENIAIMALFVNMGNLKEYLLSGFSTFHEETSNNYQS